MHFLDCFPTHKQLSSFTTVTLARVKQLLKMNVCFKCVAQHPVLSHEWINVAFICPTSFISDRLLQLIPLIISLKQQKWTEMWFAETCWSVWAWFWRLCRGSRLGFRPFKNDSDENPVNNLQWHMRAGEPSGAVWISCWQAGGGHILRSRHKVMHVDVLYVWWVSVPAVFVHVSVDERDDNWGVRICKSSTKYSLKLWIGIASDFNFKSEALRSFFFLYAISVNFQRSLFPS